MHALWSSHVLGVPIQDPSEHTSKSVQNKLSSQGSLLFVKLHVSGVPQILSVQMLSSWHSHGPFKQSSSNGLLHISSAPGFISQLKSSQSFAPIRGGLYIVPAQYPSLSASLSIDSGQISMLSGIPSPSLSSSHAFPIPSSSESS